MQDTHQFLHQITGTVDSLTDFIAIMMVHKNSFLKIEG